MTTIEGWALRCDEIPPPTIFQSHNRDANASAIHTSSLHSSISSSYMVILIGFLNTNSNRRSSLQQSFSSREPLYFGQPGHSCNCRLEDLKVQDWK